MGKNDLDWAERWNWKRLVCVHYWKYDTNWAYDLTRYQEPFPRSPLWIASIVPATIESPLALLVCCFPIPYLHDEFPILIKLYLISVRSTTATYISHKRGAFTLKVTMMEKKKKDEQQDDSMDQRPCSLDLKAIWIVLIVAVHLGPMGKFWLIRSPPLTMDIVRMNYRIQLFIDLWCQSKVLNRLKARGERRVILYCYWKQEKQS